MYSSVLTALRSGIALLFVLSTLYCNAQDTLFLTTGRKLIGKVICEDDVQYYLDQFQEDQLVHFSVLKSGVSNSSLQSDLPFLAEVLFKPTDESRRLTRVGFYLAKPIFTNLDEDNIYTKFRAFDVGVEVEERFGFKNHFSVLFSPGVSFVTTFREVYSRRIIGVTEIYNDYLLLLQVPFVTQYLYGDGRGFLVTAGINMNAPISEEVYSDLFFGLKASVGYAFRLGLGDSIRLEYFVDGRGSGVWSNGIKAAMLFGKDRYVMRIPHFPL